MTTIIAVQHAGGVTFGSDSQSTAGTEIWPRSESKIITNGPVTFGVAGPILVGATLRYMDIPPLEDDRDVERWVFTVLRPAILAAQKAAGMEGTEHGHPDNRASTLIAVAGQAFELQADLAASHRSDGIYTAGTGRGYATGALSVLLDAADLRSEQSTAIVEHAVLMALGIAQQHDTNTGGHLWVQTVQAPDHTAVALAR